MKRIPYSDPCVNGSPVPARSCGGCAESSIEQGVNLSLSAANRRLAALRQQHGAKSSAPMRSVQPAYSSEDSALADGERVENSHTVDGWLTPLHEIAQQHQAESTSKTQYSLEQQPKDAGRSPLNAVQQAGVIRVSPQILAGMLRAEAVAAGRVWLLARALDEAGRGWIHVETLREQLTGKGSIWRICGWRRLRQILAAGNGQFWQRDNQGRLWLSGQVQVAASLGVKQLSKATVELPFDVLVNKIGSVRAALFAAQHTGDAPIARATLAEITAVPERTQRHYDNVTDTQKQINWGLGATVTAANLQEHIYQYGGAAFVFKDRQGQRRLAHQLPNSYRCPFRVINQSKKRLNKKLQDLVNQGRRGNVQFERRYFADGRTMIDSKATNGYVRDQQIGGRNVWIFFDG